MNDPRQDIADALNLLDHPNATAEEIATVVLGALPTVEQLTHRLVDARRAEQATAQLLDEARAKLERTRPMADAGHALAQYWDEQPASTRDWIEETDERVRDLVDDVAAAHRATTPSPGPATHVVVEVAELERLKAQMQQVVADAGNLRAIADAAATLAAREREDAELLRYTPHSSFLALFDALDGWQGP